MANKTIYGCRNKITGVITFEGEACDSGNYVGCRVKSGIHAGQIAVTILEPYCDDIYYGCRNKTTGKFQLVIPDICCGISSVCRWCDTIQPSELYITLSGFTNCACTVWGADKSSKSFVGSSMNGVYTVPHSSGCIYTTTITGIDWGPYQAWYPENDCSGDPDDHYYNQFKITVEGFETHIKINFELYDYTASVWINPFHGTNNGVFVLNYGEEESCFDTVNAASNPCSACYEHLKSNVGGHTGEVEIAL